MDSLYNDLPRNVEESPIMLQFSAIFDAYFRGESNNLIVTRYCQPSVSSEEHAKSSLSQQTRTATCSKNVLMLPLHLYCNYREGRKVCSTVYNSEDIKAINELSITLVTQQCKSEGLRSPSSQLSISSTAHSELPVSSVRPFSYTASHIILHSYY